jgi:DNA invertase Pin-like site-specific DNA recombinase
MLRSLREGIDYSTPVGQMVAGIFASLAEYERELIHERAAVARQAARARGKQTGRPRALSPIRSGSPGGCGRLARRCPRSAPRCG